MNLCFIEQRFCENRKKLWAVCHDVCHDAQIILWTRRLEQNMERERERMVSYGQRCQTKGYFIPLSVQSVPRITNGRLDSNERGMRNGKINPLKYGDDTITLAKIAIYLK